MVPLGSRDNAAGGLGETAIAADPETGMGRGIGGGGATVGIG